MKLGKILPSFFDLNSQLNPIEEGSQKVRNLLDNVNLLQVSERLKDFIEKKDYRDEDIRLPDFAICLGLSTHQASYYLNNHLNISFTDFINYNRIEEVKRVIAKNNGRINLLEIALDCGFNSTTTFHRACKKFTGGSPKELRSRLSENGKHQYESFLAK
ncbi:helix-turn-helix domain-containing protein [Leptospira yasudae]|uniref:helix-turn-helix domain-containing protein n=1 Tax=Leptospira yasudae TaxID=2202201 RepID=UPI001FEF04D2|nr:helix-turn-helix domain-containing protein [Leptospira yasudae]